MKLISDRFFVPTIFSGGNGDSTPGGAHDVLLLADGTSGLLLADGSSFLILSP